MTVKNFLGGACTHSSLATSRQNSEKRPLATGLNWEGAYRTALRVSFEARATYSVYNTSIAKLGSRLTGFEAAALYNGSHHGKVTQIIAIGVLVTVSEAELNAWMSSQ